MSVKYVYPPPQVFTQDLGAAHPNSNYSGDSLEVPESLSTRNQQKKLCQHVFNKLIGWISRFFSYLSWKICISS